MRININLSDSGHTFKYLLEYIESDVNINPKDLNTSLKYIIDEDNIDIYDIYNTMPYNKKGNEWCLANISNSKNIMIDQYKIGKIRLYFPLYSLETYNAGFKYMLSINTWINGKYVYLGNFILDRNDAIASSEPIKFEDELYYEYIELNIIDPWDFIYGANWKSFRSQICNGEVKNNNGSCLNMTLYPVSKSPIDSKSYIMYRECNGGQNSFNLYAPDSKNNYLSFHIKEDYKNDYGFTLWPEFNSIYNNDITKYVMDTYNIKKDSYKGKEFPAYEYEMVLKNDDNIFLNPISFTRYNNEMTNNEIFISREVIRNSINNLDNIIWHRIKNSNTDGLYFMCSLNVYSHNDIDNNCLGRKENYSQEEWNIYENDLLRYYIVDDILYKNDCLTIFSNNIPITDDIAKFLSTDTQVLKINLEEMNNIKVVNKIVNNVIQIDKPQDSKSNIIVPVFFKVHDIENLILHPEVNENICINLDAYKNKVNKFVLQINGNKFNEIGSTPQGIIFKIQGSLLSVDKSEGTYYILNEKYELVTTGKYILNI